MIPMRRNAGPGSAPASRASIEMHAARDASGRVIWAEVFCGRRKSIRDMEELRLYFGSGARLKWILADGAGNSAEILPGNPDILIEDDGFTLRIAETAVRKGVAVNCILFDR